MVEHLQPPFPESNDALSPHDDTVIDEAAQLRLLNRSPHPYHHQQSEILEPAGRLEQTPTSSTSALPFPSSARRRPSPSSYRRPSSIAHHSSTSSDSGTEADDEHFLKGLPAPRRFHKGIRGRNEVISGTSTPLLSPALLEEEGRQGERRPSAGKSVDWSILELDRRRNAEWSRRQKEVVRRAAELGILAVLGLIVSISPGAKGQIRVWTKEFWIQLAVLAVLGVLYPLRVVVWAYRERSPTKRIPLRIPTSFDPAPLLYPPLIPIYVALLLPRVPEAVKLNLILSIASVPTPLIPLSQYGQLISPVQWILSCVPLYGNAPSSPAAFGVAAVITPEIGALLYPLHRTLCVVLHDLTTTSLLPAELQLLSIALINILLLATSPQAVILKTVLWGGGVALLVLCGPVVRWGIAIARVPKWRFRRASPDTKSLSILRTLAIAMRDFRRVRREFMRPVLEESENETEHSSDGQAPARRSLDSDFEFQPKRAYTLADGQFDDGTESVPVSPIASRREKQNTDPDGFTSISRRYTLPSLNRHVPSSKTHTPSGRKKRSASSSVRVFFSMTQSEADTRRWLYASWLYLCILTTILLPIRVYIGRAALAGAEPLGWALGFLVGDIPPFRLEVLKSNLERWILLPSRPNPTAPLGLAQTLRLLTIGASNTRLLLLAYWLTLVALGLAVVATLSPVYEVDTRRKVFHFMMVAMFLPATPVDSAYAALGLALALAVFLLLDLIRASQLPPLSKPIARFLTPYVDGRDLRGPVVISHIFLLIGCAVPLWLSLGALPRGSAIGVEGEARLEGWEVPSRDVSMVSGIVCVGLGDAAASLIGRRWGHRKWLWGGGKSLEGSVAFATAVFIGLMAAGAWLRLGGWAITGEESAVHGEWWTALWEWRLGRAARNSGVCAAMASLTEAVLTGGNDNVVVPVVLWTCVKSLGV